KPAVSAKHAWVTASSIAAASSSGVGESPSVSQPNCIRLLRARFLCLGQYGGRAERDQGGARGAVASPPPPPSGRAPGAPAWSPVVCPADESSRSSEDRRFADLRTLRLWRSICPLIVRR